MYIFEKYIFLQFNIGNKQIEWESTKLKFNTLLYIIIKFYNQ